MVKKSVPESGQVGVRESRRVLRNIEIPAGLPPVMLRGKVTEESIRAWAEATRKAYANDGYFLRRRGLLYLLDMYFICPLDHPKASNAACRVLDGLSDEP